MPYNMLCFMMMLPFIVLLDTKVDVSIAASERQEPVSDLAAEAEGSCLMIPGNPGA